MRTLLALLTLTCTLTCTLGCASSQIVLAPGWVHERAPDFVDYFDYYFFGLSGHSTVNLQKMCLDQKPQAAEQIRTVEDGLLTLVTLGIYAPVTVRVWCGE